MVRPGTARFSSIAECGHEVEPSCDVGQSVAGIGWEGRTAQAAFAVTFVN